MTEAETPRHATDTGDLRPGQVVALFGYDRLMVAGTLAHDRLHGWVVNQPDGEPFTFTYLNRDWQAVILQESKLTPLERLKAALEGGTVHPQGDAHFTVKADWLSELILAAQEVVDAR